MTIVNTACAISEGQSQAHVSFNRPQQKKTLFQGCQTKYRQKVIIFLDSLVSYISFSQ